MAALRKLGAYRLLSPLGEGGMARVWLAENEVGRRVVVKEMKPRLASDPTFVQLFLREAQIATRLSHGNIALVSDFGEADGVYFLVMEWVDGLDLSALLRQARERGERVPDEVTAIVLARVASALDHAHGLCDEVGAHLGIVHRDVTPQNIMVTHDGETRLLDFGVARRSEDAGLTRSGSTRGKMPYFSPEQVRLLPLDGRSDLFACGVVLYELLCGVRPFEGGTVAVLESIAHARYRDPLEVRPDLDPALAAIVRRCLALAPEDRFQRGAELEAALLGWVRGLDPRLGDETVAAWVRGLPARAQRAGSASWLLAGAAALLLGAAGLVGYTVATGSSQSLAPRPLAPTPLSPPPRATPEPSRPPAVDTETPEREELEPPARVHSAAQLLRGQSASCLSLEGRPLEALALRDVSGREPVRLARRPSTDRPLYGGPAWEPFDATWVLFRGPSGARAAVVPVARKVRAADLQPVPEGTWEQVCVLIADTDLRDNHGALEVHTRPAWRGPRPRLEVRKLGVPLPAEADVDPNPGRRQIRWLRVRAEGEPAAGPGAEVLVHTNPGLQALRRYSQRLARVPLDGTPVVLGPARGVWFWVPDAQLLGGAEEVSLWIEPLDAPSEAGAAPPQAEAKPTTEPEAEPWAQQRRDAASLLVEPSHVACRALPARLRRLRVDGEDLRTSSGSFGRMAGGGAYRESVDRILLLFRSESGAALVAAQLGRWTALPAGGWTSVCAIAPDTNVSDNTGNLRLRGEGMRATIGFREASLPVRHGEHLFGDREEPVRVRLSARSVGGEPAAPGAVLPVFVSPGRAGVRDYAKRLVVLPLDGEPVEVEGVVSARAWVPHLALLGGAEEVQLEAHLLEP